MHYMNVATSTLTLAALSASTSTSSPYFRITAVYIVVIADLPLSLSLSLCVALFGCSSLSQLILFCLNFCRVLCVCSVVPAPSPSPNPMNVLTFALAALTWPFTYTWVVCFGAEIKIWSSLHISMSVVAWNDGDPAQCQSQLWPWPQPQSEHELAYKEAGQKQEERVSKVITTSSSMLLNVRVCVYVWAYEWALMLPPPAQHSCCMVTLTMKPKYIQYIHTIHVCIHCTYVYATWKPPKKHTHTLKKRPAFELKIIYIRFDLYVCILFLK